MVLKSLVFLLGIVCLQKFLILPTLWWTCGLPVLAVFAYRFPLWRLPLFFACGFCWALSAATWQMWHALPQNLEGEDLSVEGMVVGLPDVLPSRVRFDFKIDSLRYTGDPSTFRGTVRLNWYDDAPPLRAGQRWRLNVRLKRPHGFMNPGSFDYEGWLYRTGIQATGYVRTGRENVPVEDAGVRPLSRFRQAIAEALQHDLQGRAHRAIILALAIGDRQSITTRQWDVFASTGTSHLMAISGLHVGLVAAMVFFVARFFWARANGLTLWFPAPRAAAVFAVTAALLYSALAGFSVPTQRAFIMVAVAMGAVFLQRTNAPLNSLAVALFCVLLWDPFAVLSAGFWLSFWAVTLILFATSHRQKSTLLWWTVSRIHLLLAIGLAPFLLVMFQQVSLASPIANLIAVPVVSVLVVPLVLLGTAVTLALPEVGVWLLYLADGIISLLWVVLSFLSSLSWSRWIAPQPPLWAMFCGVVGIVLLFTPRGFPLRVLGIIWCLPMLLWRPPVPAHGEAWFTVLDVGQGLASVVRTQNHVLAYDTGPRFSEDFDAGRAVVVPFLISNGVKRIDKLIIGHGDNDHVGGARSVDGALEVGEVLTSAPEAIDWRTTSPCLAGMQWTWDGVAFSFLHPRPDSDLSENDRSCVLLVRAGEDSILIPGDIERRAEKLLVSQYQDGLAAKVLVAPHHGSTTSSTDDFLDYVQPQIAIFPVGYRNRYGFPKEEVVARYLQRNVRIYDSARHGALTIHLDGSGGEIDPKKYRDVGRYYWHWKE